MPELHTSLLLAVGNVSGTHPDLVDHVRRLCPSATLMEAVDAAGLAAVLTTRSLRLVLAGADGE